MSNPKNPIITFRANLAPDLVQYLHPDRHQTNQDTAQAQAAQHKNLNSSFLPGLLAGDNVVENHDGTFTAYGLKAKYIKDEYVTKLGLLTVVTETFESA